MILTSKVGPRTEKVIVRIEQIIEKVVFLYAGDMYVWNNMYTLHKSDKARVRFVI